QAQRIEMRDVADALPAQGAPLPSSAPRPHTRLMAAAAEPAFTGSLPTQVARQEPTAPSLHDLAPASAPLPIWRPDPVLAQTATLPSPRPPVSDWQQETVVAIAAQGDGMPALRESSFAEGESVGVVETASAQANTRVSASVKQPDIVFASAPTSGSAAKQARVKQEHASAMRARANATELPRLARGAIQSIPTTIYAQGFSRGNQGMDHRRFTGSAVAFLPFVRFE
ncbi:hypothetical protein L4923_30205, partial [Mesorhizobium sp. IRAMC:0171]|nr:hypothetical protein [Mesorhizobium sp. IRAMC:0171]